MADDQTKLEWTRKYERLIRELVGRGKINSVPGDTEGRRHVHEGIDIGRPFASLEQIDGAEVRAPASGRVVRIGRTGGYGNAVVVERELRGNRVTEIFGHLQDDSIPPGLVPGASIEFGDLIGRVGATGGNYLPHLHYETRAESLGVDPADARRAAPVGPLWPDGKPPVADPEEVQDFHDLSRYTFGIEDPRVRRQVEAHLRGRFDRRHSGEVRGRGAEFDRAVREAAIRRAAPHMTVDRLAVMSDEDFAWATHGDYWRTVMDPAFRSR